MQGSEPVPPPGWTDQLEREFRSVDRDRHIRICYAGDVLNMPRLADLATREQFGATLWQVAERLELGAGTGVGRERASDCWSMSVRRWPVTINAASET